MVSSPLKLNVRFFLFFLRVIFNLRKTQNTFDSTVSFWVVITANVYMKREKWLKRWMQNNGMNAKTYYGLKHFHSTEQQKDLNDHELILSTFFLPQTKKYHSDSMRICIHVSCDSLLLYRKRIRYEMESVWAGEGLGRVKNGMKELFYTFDRQNKLIN